MAKKIAWPKNPNKPADYESLIDPVVKTIKKTYRMTKKKITGPIPWDGVDDIGPTGRASSPTKLKEILSRATLKYHEERGRDLLEVLIMVAVSCGIEQGRRIQRERLKSDAILIGHYGVDGYLAKFGE